MMNIKMRIRNNINAAYRFLYDINSTVTLIPALCLCISQNASFNKIAYVILNITFFIYHFQVGNQITDSSIQEDLINKPFRPIASGIITKKEGYYHFYLSLVLYLITSYIFDVIHESILWIFISYLLNFTWLGKNGIMKNLLLFPGMYYLIYSILVIINGKTSLINCKKKILLICLYFILNIFIQDLKDHKGDLRSNRKTLSIIYGFDKIRKILTTGPITSIILHIIEIYLYPKKRYLNNHLYFILTSFCLVMIIINLLGTYFSKYNVKTAYKFVCLYTCILFLCFPKKIN